MQSSLPTRAATKLGQALRDMPIRRKLTLVVVVTTGLAVVLAGVGLMIADYALFLSSLKNDLTALARITADNTTASLSFIDPNAATETLRALRARRHVVNACVFQPDGRLFAEYTRPNAAARCPAPAAAREIRKERDALVISRPIVLDKRRVGTLVIVYDLGETWERIQLFGLTVFGVFLVSSLIAFLLSARLRSFITTPILELARVTTNVSQSRDYSMRAEKFSGDELGLLVDAFNEMLSSIQSRDIELHGALAARGVALEEVQKARESLQASLGRVARLNEELRNSNLNLARSNEDLERFAFIASHDLQEPLRMITVYLQLFAREYNGNLNDNAAKYMQNVQGGAKRMRDLLADLLAYAEIGARFDTPAQPVDLNAVVRKAQENLSVALTESGAIVNAGRLPVVVGFESHFVPVFQNLIGNAIKYRSEQRPVIDIWADRSDNNFRICIADNGIGIAPEYHSKIFVAFKRLHGNDIPGTGIGLAICQRVVEKYGGRIWVDSDIGRGSKFFLVLPVTLLVDQSTVVEHN